MLKNYTGLWRKRIGTFLFSIGPRECIAFQNDVASISLFLFVCLFVYEQERRVNNVTILFQQEFSTCILFFFSPTKQLSSRQG